MTKKYFLPEWTNKVLKDTGWTQTELAQKAGLSRTAINDVVNNKIKGGYKYAIAIAEAADRPLDEALQAAGLMDIVRDQDEVSKEILHNVYLMDDDNKLDTLEYVKMRMKVQKRGKGKDNDNHPSNRPPTS